MLSQGNQNDLDLMPYEQGDKTKIYNDLFRSGFNRCIYFYFLCISEFTYMHTCVPGALGGEKRASDSLVLKYGLL